MQAPIGSVPVVRTIPYSNGLRRMHVIFDSAYRVNNSNGSAASESRNNTRPLFNLVSFGTEIDHARVAVRSVIIPLTFHTINSTNNVFRIDDNGTGRTITITPGFHTATTLVADINATLTAATSSIVFYAYDAPNNPDFEVWCGEAALYLPVLTHSSSRARSASFHRIRFSWIGITPTTPTACTTFWDSTTLPIRRPWQMARISNCSATLPST
jgi:hypothetical protein